MKFVARSMHVMSWLALFALPAGAYWSNKTDWSWLTGLQQQPDVPFVAYANCDRYRSICTVKFAGGYPGAKLFSSYRSRKNKTKTLSIMHLDKTGSGTFHIKMRCAHAKMRSPCEFDVKTEAIQLLDDRGESTEAKVAFWRARFK